MTIAHMSKRVATILDGRMSFRHFVLMAVVFAGGAMLTQYKLWTETTELISAHAHELQQPVQYPTIFSNLITKPWVPGIYLEPGNLFAYFMFSMILVSAGLAATWLLVGVVLFAFPSVRSKGAGLKVIGGPLLVLALALAALVLWWLLGGRVLLS